MPGSKRMPSLQEPRKHPADAIGVHVIRRSGNERPL
jgi:hypothetical protein